MNGKAKLITWLVGVLQTMLITGLLYWVAKVDRIEARAVTDSARITRLEAQYDEILRRLDRIETKVDNVDKDLERRGDRSSGRSSYLLDGEPGFDELRRMDAPGSSRRVSAGEHTPQAAREVK